MCEQVRVTLPICGQMCQKYITLYLSTEGELVPKIQHMVSLPVSDEH